MSKLALQDAAEDLKLADDKMVERELFEAFPKPMRKPHADAIRAHRLRNEILGDAGRQPPRQSPRPERRVRPDRGRGRVARAGDRRLPRRRAPARPCRSCGRRSRPRPLPEMVRVELFAIAASSVRAHLSDILRATGGETSPSALCKLLEPGVRKISAAAGKLIRSEVRNEAAARRERLISLGASEDIVRGLVRLFELDGMFGIAALAARKKTDELALASAYTKLGEGAWHRLGAAAARAVRARRSVGAAADRRTRARFRAAADRFPRPPARQGPGRRRRGLDRASSARGSSSSATSSGARATKGRSARRCLRRSPPRRASCSLARAVRLAFLVPDAGLSGGVGLGVRCRGRGASQARGAMSTPCRGRRRVTCRAMTWSCRSSSGVITCSMLSGSRWLEQIEAERLAVVNPPALLRWNSDKAYLTELAAKGIPTVETHRGRMS